MTGRKQAGDAWSGASERLAGLLREQRKSEGLSQEAVARKANLALSTVRKIETGGIREPGIFTVVALLLALELELSTLEAVLGSVGSNEGGGVSI